MNGDYSIIRISQLDFFMVHMHFAMMALYVENEVPDVLQQQYFANFTTNITLFGINKENYYFIYLRVKMQMVDIAY